MVRYSFLVGLFHPRLHAGLSRRLHSLTVAARSAMLMSRDREGAVYILHLYESAHAGSEI
jgi:hypothetical protein